jgi:hypothetical protein
MSLSRTLPNSPELSGDGGGSIVEANGVGTARGANGGVKGLCVAVVELLSSAAGRAASSLSRAIGILQEDKNKTSTRCHHFWHLLGYFPHF